MVESKMNYYNFISYSIDLRSTLMTWYVTSCCNYLLVMLMHSWSSNILLYGIRFVTLSPYRIICLSMNSSHSIINMIVVVMMVMTPKMTILILMSLKMLFWKREPFRDKLTLILMLFSIILSITRMYSMTHQRSRVLTHNTSPWKSYCITCPWCFRY